MDDAAHRREARFDSPIHGRSTLFILRAYLKVRGASVLLPSYLDPFQKHIRAGKVVQDVADECRLVKGTP